MLIPYEQFFIHTTNTNNFFTDQNPGEQNPLIQLGIDATHTSLLDQYIPLNTWASSDSAMRAAGNDKRYVHI
jgi:hypothetical protein